MAEQPLDSQPAPSRTVWSYALLFALAPAILAVAQLGRIHPDEVYQMLEPAFVKAFGYGVLAWEWREGARNWAIPGFFSWLLKLCRALGIEDPRAYRAALEVPQYLLHAASLWAAYRYVERRVQGPWALAVFPLLGLYGPVLTFAGRTMGESFSASFLLLAVEALDRPAARFRDGLWAGAALGLSVVARYPSAVMVVAALGWIIATRRWRLLAGCLAAGALVAALLGLLDWASWGRPFHSLLKYVDFNVLSGEAARRFGRDGAAYYLPSLLKGLAPWAWVGLGLALAVQRAGRAALPSSLAMAYWAAILLAAHKEHRFIYPALVLLSLAAAGALLQALAKLRNRGLRGGLLALSVASSTGVFFWAPELAVQRPDQFRAIVKATRGEATGFLLVNEGLWGAGGNFYIGKNIPWQVCDWPQDHNFRAAMANRRFNRVVTYEGRALEELKAAGFVLEEQLGQASILSRH